MKPLIDFEGKVCNVCKTLKHVSEYYPNKSCSLGVVGTCKVCSKERVSSWYSSNRKRRQEIANTKNRKRKQQIVEHFGNACHDCGNTFPQCVYCFHHLDPSQKDMNPSTALSLGEMKMWRELAKCIMICANCHMIRHHNLERKETIDYAAAN